MVVVRVAPLAIRLVVTVLMLLVMSPLFGTTAQAAPGDLTTMLQDVKNANGHQYDAHDNDGVGLDTAKIISKPGGGYLAVYHHLIANVFQVRLAQSEDLQAWHDAVTLEGAASQPTIAALSDGSFLVAYEKRGSGTICRGSGSCLGFRHYADIGALLGNDLKKSITVVLNRTLSACHEGTPNIYAATLNPDIMHSVINVGFHYHRDCQLDQQARGTLTNFSAWTAQPDSSINTLFTNYNSGEIKGHVGDRDAFYYEGRPYSLIEAQSTKDDFKTWRPYLFDRKLNSLTMLKLDTPGQSSSFGNPTYTELRIPGGQLGFVSTEFVFSEGAGPAEAGVLVYYSAFPTQPGPDTTPPGVSVTQPADRSTVRRGSAVTVAASASDDVGVAKVAFYVNGTLTCVSPFAPYSCTWTVPPTPGVAYTITARAFDTSSNTAQAVARVTSQ
jgi:hypothetical protein